MTRAFAHTRKTPEGATEYQSLLDHLAGVGDLASGFAAAAGMEEWGRLAGLWHDLGKFSTEFQAYLTQESDPDLHQAELRGRIDHSSAGAIHAVERLGLEGHLLAYPISGHHSGLLDGRSDRACLEARLAKKGLPEWRHGVGSLPVTEAPEVPHFVRQSIGCRDAFSVAFFVRMLFSCLVDADFLDTERFIDAERAEARARWPADVLARMERALSDYVVDLSSNLEDTPVNRHRVAVRQACLAAAAWKPGLFSLTVPTGGGKTLSSLAFALAHAAKHRLRRVIYVIPFTSIIEQNAEIFRRAMASLVQAGLPDPIVEHHSDVDTGVETVESRLATENWEAPLIVTTSVQFYESLFANRTSRCRKLHNLARSVVILDEVQTLPVDYLKPCLAALRELSSNYETTIVLCTATQPAIHRRKDFSIGLNDVREIIPAPRELYNGLRRVVVEDIGHQSDAALVRRLTGHRQVLCVVNTRGHARKLYDAIEGDRFHLSALMCPAHRSETLTRIRERLDSGQECRVVSTQLIEAGVDIDFPVVYRAMGGLDSLAQAAGRCNRNGRLGGLGYTFVFRSEHSRSEAFFRDTASCAEQVLGLHRDPLSLEAIEHFFRLYYWDQSSRWDFRGIVDSFGLLQDRALPFSFGFATVAKAFRLIEDDGKPVIVPWGSEGRVLADRLRYAGDRPSRTLLRRLQRFTVRVPTRLWERHVDRSIERIHDRYPLLSSPETHYSEEVGLALDEAQPVFLEV